MTIFLYRLVRLMVHRRAWALPATLVAFVFVTSWPLMALAEPAHAGIVAPGNYWWWFLVTTATVGYGDYYPVTVAGHIVGVYVIVGGIVTLTMLFARLIATLERAKGLAMRGQATLNVSDHILLFGYAPGRTERIAEALLADSGRRVVLCTSNDVDTDPLPDHDVDFVRGDLHDAAVLRRAGAHRAYGMLIDVRDDNEALSVLVAADHVGTGAHIVVALRDLGRSDHLRRAHAGVHCVDWNSPHMITEEIQTPGIARVYGELMSHGGRNTYSMHLPGDVTPVGFGACQMALGRQYDVTVLAVRVDDEVLVSPSWATVLPAGTVLYYVSARRLAPAEVSRALAPDGAYAMSRLAG